MTEQEQKRSALLNLAYDVVHYLGNNTFFCADKKSEQVEVITGNNDIVYKGSLDNCICSGRFFGIKKTKNETSRWGSTTTYRYVELHNFSKNKSIDVPDYKLRGVDRFLLVDGDDLEEYQGVTKIYNEELDLVGKIFGHCLGHMEDSIRETSEAVYVSYWNYGGLREAKLNKTTGKIDYFCISRVNVNSIKINIAAVENCNHGYCINRASQNSYKYVPYDYNKIMYGKTYQDILPLSLNGEYLFVTDYDSKNRKSYGIITNTNCEVLPVEFESMKYIGNNNIRVDLHKDSNGTQLSFIFSINSMTRSQLYRKEDIIEHNTLPILFVKKPDQTVVLDYYGRLFDIKDFGKYFDYYAASDNGRIRKVVIGGINHYIDDMFYPITNMSKIKTFANKEWIKIE